MSPNRIILGKLVVTSDLLVKEELVVVKRTWKERFRGDITQSRKVVTRSYPSPDVLLIAGKLYIHPVTLRELEKTEAWKLAMRESELLIAISSSLKIPEFKLPNF